MKGRDDSKKKFKCLFDPVLISQGLQSIARLTGIDVNAGDDPLKGCDLDEVRKDLDRFRSKSGIVIPADKFIVYSDDTDDGDVFHPIDVSSIRTSSVRAAKKDAAAPSDSSCTDSLDDEESFSDETDSYDIDDETVGNDDADDEFKELKKRFGLKECYVRLVRIDAIYPRCRDAPVNLAELPPYIVMRNLGLEHEANLFRPLLSQPSNKSGLFRNETKNMKPNPVDVIPRVPVTTRRVSDTNPVHLRSKQQNVKSRVTNTDVEQPKKDLKGKLGKHVLRLSTKASAYGSGTSNKCICRTQSVFGNGLGTCALHSSSKSDWNLYVKGVRQILESKPIFSEGYRVLTPSPKLNNIDNSFSAILDPSRYKRLKILPLESRRLSYNSKNSLIVGPNKSGSMEPDASSTSIIF